MSKFFENEATMPQPATPGSDIFGPRPKELEQKAEEVKSRHGENSFEYASALVRWGDAHMIQGKLSNPQALGCYEQAMKIVSAAGESTAETAFVFDKLANVKQSSGDTAAAAIDLAKAIEIWKVLDANSRFVTDHHMERRIEDLTRMERVVAFNSRRPPEL
ncbi:MAG: tetratricopeptide repeat protein [Cyanobacteria bacterium SZAS-4]|nr:tetratricopeptide repeat protein [Cyanobacteria bacterium SZAS-4]